MLQVKINEKVFEIENGDINGTPANWDLLDYKDGSFHILRNNKSYRAQIVSSDEENKSLTLMVNGNEYTLHLKDKFDILLEKLGMNQMASSKVNNIKAPMPGLVLAVNVAVGDTVAKGDAVMILEAMKMENLIKSPGDGEIKSINIKQGEAVEKGQVLIELS